MSPLQRRELMQKERDAQIAAANKRRAEARIEFAKKKQDTSYGKKQQSLP